MAARPDLDPRVDPRARAFLAPIVAAQRRYGLEDMTLEQLREAWRAREKIGYELIWKRAAGDSPHGDLISYTVDIEVNGAQAGTRMFLI